MGNRPGRRVCCDAGQPLGIAIARADPTQGRRRSLPGGPGQPQRLLCERHPGELSGNAQRQRQAPVRRPAADFPQSRRAREYVLAASADGLAERADHGAAHQLHYHHPGGGHPRFHAAGAQPAGSAALADDRHVVPAQRADCAAAGKLGAEIYRRRGDGGVGTRSSGAGGRGYPARAARRKRDQHGHGGDQQDAGAAGPAANRRGREHRSGDSGRHGLHRAGRHRQCGFPAGIGHQGDRARR